MADKLRVFVSHSFEDDDRELVERVVELMKHRRFHLDVRTARPPEGRRFPDKIEDCIDWADVTFGLFSKKFTDGNGRALPPPYVISECSFALGRYKDLEHKAVHGFVEKGIEYSHLGLPTAKGAEFPAFTRQGVLEGHTAELEHFLSDLYNRYGSKGRSRPHPYRQKYLKKTVEIFRNGTGVFKNTTTMMIGDGDFLRKRGNSFDHTIWLPSGPANFPDLRDMMETPISQRLQRPMFYCRFIRAGKAPKEKPLKVELVSQVHREIAFRVYMPFDVKPNDLLTYQYAWSMPGVFRAFEEDFVDENDYDEVALRTNHGLIQDVTFRLKFEREGKHGYDAALFSKAPFVLYSLRPTEHSLALDDPNEVTRVEPESTWEIYEVRQKNLDGAVTMRWRPASRASSQRELGTASKAVGSERAQAGPAVKEG